MPCNVLCKCEFFCWFIFILKDLNIYRINPKPPQNLVIHKQVSKPIQSSSKTLRNFLSKKNKNRNHFTICQDNVNVHPQLHNTTTLTTVQIRGTLWSSPSCEWGPSRPMPPLRTLLPSSSKQLRWGAGLWSLACSGHLLNVFFWWPAQPFFVRMNRRETGFHTKTKIVPIIDEKPGNGQGWSAKFNPLISCGTLAQGLEHGQTMIRVLKTVFAPRLKKIDKPGGTSTSTASEKLG